MQKPMLMWGIVLIVAVVTWVGWGTLPAWAQRAHVPQTGQTQCWETDFTTLQSTLIPCDGTGQDGDIQAGVSLPTPRFTENGNGAVTDRLTGLIWLRQANCFGTLSWLEALAVVKTLAHGSCGLTDRSQAGDWRVPNARELYSLVDLDFSPVVLSNTAGTGVWTEGNPFLGVVEEFTYWSSTTVPRAPYAAFTVGMAYGHLFSYTKNEQKPVWPVRGGD